MGKVFDFASSSRHGETRAVNTRRAVNTTGSGFGSKLFLEKLACLFLTRIVKKMKLRFFCFGSIIYKLAWGGGITQMQKCGFWFIYILNKISSKTTMVISHLIDCCDYVDLVKGVPDISWRTCARTTAQLTASQLVPADVFVRITGLENTCTAQLVFLSSLTYDYV